MKRHPSSQLVHWLKHTGRPALNRLLAKYSEVGDPVVFTKEAFPWSKQLEVRWQEIRSEVELLLELRDHTPSFHEVSTDQYRISQGDDWKTVWLYGFGYQSKIGPILCPRTTEALTLVPGLKSALFSMLSPGTHIPAHRGVFKGMINCHLALIVPRRMEDCRIRVGDQDFHWEPGQVYMFDDTNEHEVWNDTEDERVVLFLQFERPMSGIGRVVSRIFLSALRLTPYISDPLKRIGQFEDRLLSAARSRGLVSDDSVAR